MFHRPIANPKTLQNDNKLPINTLVETVAPFSPIHHGLQEREVQCFEPFGPRARARGHG